MKCYRKLFLITSCILFILKIASKAMNNPTYIPLAQRGRQQL